LTFDLLLADASPMMQRIVELTFAGSDVQVTAVRDGDEAVRRITETPPDIVLADHALARRSGYEISAFVKSRSELAHIPVVLLAGAFEPIDQIRAAQVGCDGVIGKPFEPHQLTARVHELLARDRRPPAHGVEEPEPATPVATAPSGAAGEDRLDPDGADRSPDAVEADERQGSGAESASLVPTVTALLAAAVPPDHRTEPAGAAGPAPAAVPEAAAGAGEPPWTPRGTPLTDLSELAEALGAFRRRPPEPAPREPAPPEAPSIQDPSPPGPVAQSPLASEELVEEVTRRVLEKLAPDAVEGIVGRVVSEVAARLLREELDRVRRGEAVPPDAR
jgi:CheY-like chemotaxis protein